MNAHTIENLAPEAIKSRARAWRKYHPAQSKEAISLCSEHHAEQHRLGEVSFEMKYALDLLAVAEQFARLSPHRDRLAEL